jgi:hypothetical protein
MCHLEKGRNDTIPDELRGHAWGVVADLTNQQED